MSPEPASKRALCSRCGWDCSHVSRNLNWASDERLSRFRCVQCGTVNDSSLGPTVAVRVLGDPPERPR